MTDPLHKPVDIISIIYLLSSESLLQSLDLVHLQFLEQWTDLGITCVDKEDKNQKFLKNACMDV